MPATGSRPDRMKASRESEDAFDRLNERLDRSANRHSRPDRRRPCGIHHLSSVLLRSITWRVLPISRFSSLTCLLTKFRSRTVPCIFRWKRAVRLASENGRMFTSLWATGRRRGLHRRRRTPGDDPTQTTLHGSSLGCVGVLTQNGNPGVYGQCSRAVGTKVSRDAP